MYMPVMATTDAQLLLRARDDPEALGELYLRYRGRLNAWFCARAPESIASELTAEVFAQVALNLKRFRDEAGGSAGPWLFGIAKNLLRRYYQRGRVEEAARRRLAMPIRSYELDLDAVDERLAAADSGLGAALASLPDSQRNALELRVLEDLPYRDVAGVLGCTETAARIRVMRALDRLARLLGAACA